MGGWGWARVSSRKEATEMADTDGRDGREQAQVCKCAWRGVVVCVACVVSVDVVR